VPRLELVDDRYGKLAEELRTSRPVAPVSLRTQVRALEPPGPRWTFRRPSRRVGLALAGAALLASFVAAGVSGLSGPGTKQRTLGAVKPPARSGAGGGARAVAPTETWISRSEAASAAAAPRMAMMAAANAVPRMVFDFGDIRDPFPSCWGHNSHKAFVSPLIRPSNFKANESKY